MTKDDLDEMVILSQIPILDGEEWSLSEAIDSADDDDENQSDAETD